MGSLLEVSYLDGIFAIKLALKVKPEYQILYQLGMYMYVVKSEEKDIPILEPIFQGQLLQNRGLFRKQGRLFAHAHILCCESMHSYSRDIRCILSIELMWHRIFGPISFIRAWGIC